MAHIIYIIYCLYIEKTLKNYKYLAHLKVGVLNVQRCKEIMK